MNLESLIQTVQVLNFDNDLSNIITQHLVVSTDSCNLEAMECLHVTALKEMIAQNNPDSIEIVPLLNNFNHLLIFHDKTEQDIETIYDLFGGICTIDKCKQLKRFYRNRNDEDVDIQEYQLNGKDANDCVLLDFLSKIHCHIHHQYDIGFRLRKSDWDKTIECEDDKQDEFVNQVNGCVSMTSNNKFSLIKKIISEKYAKLQSLSLYFRNLKHNKFSTDLNKIAHNSNYSYSFEFIYNEQFENDETERCDGSKWKELYVTQKHSSLKEEILKNQVCTLSSTQWKQIITKAMYLIQTHNSRMLSACTREYRTYYQQQANHPIHFGYNDGDVIKLNHLVAIYIYCAYDKLQYKFSQTYRFIHDNENMQDVINRHCHFYHMARTIITFVTTNVQKMCQNRVILQPWIL